MTYTCANTRSLYIHWPFCPYKCHFCPFVALAGHDQFMGQYHEALRAEIEHFAAAHEKLTLDTIFFGGGTPSTYPDDLLLDMSGTLNNAFALSDATEITIEVNPGTVRQEQLSIWRKVGINRLSVGVQSLKDGVLQSLNRHQTADQVHHLLKMASAEFSNISVDLILGLPGVAEAEWRALIAQVVTWPIQHVSVYFLTVHEDTPLYFKVRAGKISLARDEAVVNLYYWTRDFLEEHGFAAYETSNFARPGYQSRHNQIYWERKPYKGFGLGACSFDGASRFQNQKNLMNYIRGALAGHDITIFSETLSDQQIFLEELMLGLRTPRGVGREHLEQQLSGAQRARFNEKLTELKHHNLVMEKDGVIRLTAAGLVVENEVVTQLAQ